MSGFTSSSSSNNIKTEIVRLVESQKEKASLLAYFTKYQDQQTEVFSDLSNFEADEDLVTLRLSCLVYEDDLKSIVEDIKEKLGDIYELSARLEISKLQVSNYASKFEAFVIFGLVSFALPRKQLPFENASYDTQAYLLFFRANELSNHIYVKTSMRQKLEELIKYITLSNLHELADKADLALKDWGQALLVPFYYRLNIDLRGRTSGIDITNIKIELGEIKSSKVSKAIKKGYRQLLFEKDICPKTDSNFKAPPKEWKEDINFSSSADYHVDVVI
ncbi:5684_t:CDS:2 [Rhizophagus irregularis]|nr:5684_t:CDS:2 [Rhizophagus irregularis]